MRLLTYRLPRRIWHHRAAPINHRPALVAAELVASQAASTLAFARLLRESGNAFRSGRRLRWAMVQSWSRRFEAFFAACCPCRDHRQLRISMYGQSALNADLASSFVIGRISPCGAPPLSL